MNNKIIAVLLMAACILSSCHEKGCTNRNALNYNVTADHDDGSCIICNATVTNLASVSVYLVDNNSGSQFHNQKVARFDLNQPLTGFSYSQCGVASCTVNLVINNLVNKSIDMNWEIERFSGPVDLVAGNDAFISANSALNQGTIETFNGPPYLPISLDSITVFSDNITYN